MAAADEVSSSNFRRLQHEYSLASELDSDWAALPVALSRYEGRPALILRDPGGEALDGLIARQAGRPIDVSGFLRMAVGLATAVAAAHRKRLIRKDLKPAN